MGSAVAYHCAKKRLGEIVQKLCIIGGRKRLLNFDVRIFVKVQFREPTISSHSELYL